MSMLRTVVRSGVVLLGVWATLSMLGCGNDIDYGEENPLDSVVYCGDPSFTCDAGLTCVEVEDAWECIREPVDTCAAGNPIDCICEDLETGAECFDEEAPECWCQTPTFPEEQLEGGCAEAGEVFCDADGRPAFQDLCGTVTVMAACETDEVCMLGGCRPVGSTPPNGTRFRYVLIEDLSEASAGEQNPGADIDAVSVVVGGVEKYAMTVEDHNVLHSGSSMDTTNLLGAPDSQCEAQNFVSLGGVGNEGWIVVGFANATEDVTFVSGDTIYVYELGPSTCPNQPSWTDDPYQVTVSVGNILDTFTQVGRATAMGTNAFRVP